MTIYEEIEGYDEHVINLCVLAFHSSCHQTPIETR